MTTLETVIQALWDRPWASAGDLAAATGRHLSQVNRALRRLEQEGMVSRLRAGRRRPPCYRYIFSSLGIAEYSARFGPAPWWLTEWGTWSLLGRMEQLEAFYSLAPNIFQGEGAQWDALGRELKLQRFGFFQRGQLVEAWGQYGEDIVLYFSWIGMKLKEPLIRNKWDHRLDRLMWRDKHGPESLLDPQDPPDLEPPDPSGHVIIGADRYAAVLASQILPGDGSGYRAWCYVDGKTMEVLHREGLATEKHRYAEDYGRVPEVGYPEAVIARAEALAAPMGTLETKVFELVEEWLALRTADIARLCGQPRSKVRAILRRFADAGLVVRVGNVYYLGPAGYRYAGRRDRVSPASPRARHAAYLNDNQARHRHQLRHNAMVNRIVVAVTLQGGQIYGGWRGVINLPGRTQVAPDALLVASSIFGDTVYRLEAERNARTPGRVRDKLLPYAIAGGAGSSCPACFALEDALVEQLFNDLGRDIKLLTTLMSDLERGPVEGRKTVWRHRGEPVDFESL